MAIVRLIATTRISLANEKAAQAEILAALEGASYRPDREHRLADLPGDKQPECGDGGESLVREIFGLGPPDPDVALVLGTPIERPRPRKDIPDFFLPSGLAIEVKLKTQRSKMDVFRQLQRYAAHEEVRALLLITNLSMGLPSTIGGKPAYYAALGAAWL